MNNQIIYDIDKKSILGAGYPIAPNTVFVRFSGGRGRPLLKNIQLNVVLYSYIIFLKQWKDY